MMSSSARNRIDEYKRDPLKCLEQIELCNYECEAGTLELNVAWQAIRELLIEKEGINSVR